MQPAPAVSSCPQDLAVGAPLGHEELPGSPDTRLIGSKHRCVWGAGGCLVHVFWEGACAWFKGRGGSAILSIRTICTHAHVLVCMPTHPHTCTHNTYPRRHISGLDAKQSGHAPHEADGPQPQAPFTPSSTLGQTSSTLGRTGALSRSMLTGSGMERMSLSPLLQVGPGGRPSCRRCLYE